MTFGTPGAREAGPEGPASALQDPARIVAAATDILTRADVQMLHGVMRQMVRWKERG